MGLWDKIKAFFGSGGGAPSRGSGSSGYSDADGIYFYFRCKQCGEVVRVRAHRRNDLNRDDGGPAPLVLRKEVMGKKCYRLMRAELWLDESYSVVSAEVEGGELATEADYEAQQARQDAPPTA